MLISVKHKLQAYMYHMYHI